MKVAKKQMCILMRSGIQIWGDEDRIENLKKILTHLKESKFVEYNNQMINTADISGIFTPDTMDELTRRKNGQWKCSVGGNWHERNEKCNCLSEEGKKNREKLEKHYEETYGPGIKPL